MIIQAFHDYLQPGDCPQNVTLILRQIDHTEMYRMSFRT